ncbi:PREDICTED: neurotrypsin-like [Amphimedon queenslandica]|uniref:SRCR domain-containing protein n=1 Tax=Amphimedon queenslandica TaxID=400682 RepID=A0AAN0K4Y0_AMPQE|nr:PREDICTED: neurotrypsin-like [Amphimedon queenslandica]|eukprot:XP_019864254.1 PREDICTED: neurotrypsin-like [Amphimedon queenslandica]
MQLVIFLVLGASICAISHGCSHGTVKFMNQTTLSMSFGSLQSGTVIICINGKWSFVCSNKWSHIVAKVTCVDMGLSHYGAMAFPLIPSSSVNLPISVSSISCRGDELSLLECSIKTIGKAAAGTAPTAEIEAVGFMGHDDSDDTIEVSSGSGSGSQPVTHCPGHAVAGIICQNKSNGDHSKCATGDLQLDTLTGKLEICINNRWGGVCHENWTSKETLVVHKQLAMDCPLEGNRRINNH